jgi:prolyl oligopeptidase
MSRRWWLPGGALAALAILLAQPSRAERPSYPPSAVIEVADTLHGRVLVDPYRWLEDDSSAAVREWIDRQNAFTRRTLDALSGRAALERRLGELYAIPAMSRPRASGGRLFFSRRSGTQNQPVVFVQPADGGGPAKPVLDPNTLAADGTVAIDWMYPSPDGALIAYGTSPGGSEKSTLRVRRVADGQDLGEAIAGAQFASVAWDPDAKGFHYTRHPARGEVPKGEEVFHRRVYYHRIGDDPGLDALVWGGEGRPIQENRSVTATSDGRWVLMSASLDWAKNDLFLRPVGGDQPFAPIAEGLAGIVQADAWDGRLFLRTNVGAPRYRLMVADPARPEFRSWNEIVPEQKGVIEDFEIAGGRIAIEVSENATSRLRIHALDGTFEKEVALPAPGTISELTGEPGRNELFFVFNGFAHPPMIYRYDLTKGKLQPLEKPSAALDPGTVEVRQESVTSGDGADVPIFIVHRKGLAVDGQRPTILFGYGGFNVSESPVFKPNVMPWIEAGGVYVQACLRGGGEFGKEWHEAGRLERKQNAFDDFYAVAGWLQSHGITRPERLAAQGGSNGGLLVGAALTQRPELFGAVVCQVPLLDMIRYQRFSIARYWVPEYGSSEDPKQFEFLLRYSPYQNVREGVPYPATLITTAESDSRVAPLHARKMTAMLQARTSGDAPILLRAETRAGHGAGKPAAKRIDEAVDILSFLMNRLGLAPRP